jgi:lipoprotein-releasing system permease protein
VKILPLLVLYQRTFLFSKRTHRLSLSFCVSVLSLAVGFGSVVIAMTVFYSFRYELEKTLMSSSGHLSLFLEDFSQNQKRYENLVKDTQGIQASSFFAMSEALIASHSSIATTIVRTLSQEHSSMTRLIESQTQKNLEDFWKKRDIPYAFLGSELAEKLQVASGDFVDLVSFSQNSQRNKQRLQIKGFVSTGLSAYDERLVLVPRTVLASGVFQTKFENFLELTLTEPRQAPLMAEHLRQQGFEANSWYDFDRSLFDQIDRDSQSIKFVIFILLFLACFNLVSTLLLSLADREFDIATWRVMGLSSSSLFGGLILWSSFMTFLGAGIGLFLSLLTLKLISLYPLGDLKDLYYLNSFPVYYRPSLMLGVFFVTWLLALFASSLVLKKLLAISPLMGLKGGMHD